jgi:hypothetical protein
MFVPTPSQEASSRQNRDLTAFRIVQAIAGKSDLSHYFSTVRPKPMVSFLYFVLPLLV